MTIAAHRGYVKIIELLLSKGASINTKNKDGAKTLMIAKTNGYKEIATLLLKKEEANINEKRNHPTNETIQNQKCIRIS